LRSRKYRKGNSIYLHTKQNHSSKFSALGVLTDLWMKEKEHQWSYVFDHWRYELEDEQDKIYVGLSSTKRTAIDNEVKGLLSPFVMKWAGLNDSVASLPSLSNFKADQREEIQSVGASIAALDHMSFKEVAGVIEKGF